MFTSGMFVLVAGLISSSTGEPLRPEPRIIGGSPVTAPIPHKVLIHMKRGDDTIVGAWCGGTIILPHYILTAAHCFNGIRRPDGQIHLDDQLVAIRVAVNTFTNPYENNAPITITQIFIHPNYARTDLTSDNDIAIVHVQDDLTQQGGTQACLPFDPTYAAVPADDSKACTAGFGYTKHYLYGNEPAFPIASPIMNRISGLNVLNSVPCLAMVQAENPSAADAGRVKLTGMLQIANQGNLQPNLNRFCTKSPKREAIFSKFYQSVCKHDSGSGFEQEFFVNNATDKLSVTVGVVTHGFGCGDERYPTINQRIVAYKDWISATTGAAPAVFIQNCTNNIIPGDNSCSCGCVVQ